MNAPAFLEKSGGDMEYLPDESSLEVLPVAYSPLESHLGGGTLQQIWHMKNSLSILAWKLIRTADTIGPNSILALLRSSRNLISLNFIGILSLWLEVFAICIIGFA